MCGIAGIYHFDDESPVPVRLLESMADAWVTGVQMLVGSGFLVTSALPTGDFLSLISPVEGSRKRPADGPNEGNRL